MLLRTYTGKLVDAGNLRPIDIDIMDIAHSLSHTSRYNGHSPEFYSVAQHSVLCSSLVDVQYALEAVLHDASECYLGDLVSPVKQMFPEFCMLERQVQARIAARFGLPTEISRAVHDIDRRVLRLEMASFGMGDGLIDQPIRPQSPGIAKLAFIRRWNLLGKLGCHKEPYVHGA